MPNITEASGYVLGPAQGAAGLGPDVKASRRSTGSMTVVESRTSGGPPRYTHTHEDEAFYVLNGTITVGCGKETDEAGPGAFVFLPRGVPHEWDVVGDEATVLIITAPGGREVFLDELHAPGAARIDVASRHGITWGNGA